MISLRQKLAPGQHQTPHPAAQQAKYPPICLSADRSTHTVNGAQIRSICVLVAYELRVKIRSCPMSVSLYSIYLCAPLHIGEFGTAAINSSAVLMPKHNPALTRDRSPTKSTWVERLYQSVLVACYRCATVTFQIPPGISLTRPSLSTDTPIAASAFGSALPTTRAVFSTLRFRLAAVSW